MSGVFYAASEMAAPWGIDIPPLPGTMVFHLLTQGSAVIEVAGDQVPLVPGAVMLVPHGTGHAILDAPGSPAVPCSTFHAKSSANATSGSGWSVLARSASCCAARCASPASASHV